MPHNFSRTLAAIESGIRERMHLGAQLFVSREGDVMIDRAFGEARGGVPMTPNTISLWFSAGKPLTAIVIARCVERSMIEWTTPVAEVLPQFGQGGKDKITLAQVLNHTAGLHALDPIDPSISWNEKLARICHFALPLDWVPGERAAYSSTAGWYVLGAVAEKLLGHPLNVALREVTQKFGMAQTRLCFEPHELIAAREHCAVVYDTSTAPSPLAFWNSDAGFTTLVPGGSARGPVRELGKFYETLLRGDNAIVSEQTLRTLTARQRSGLFDETFQYKTDTGYGFILNSNRDGFQMPYGYGRAASGGTFGHSGNQTSCAFADPARKLVVAWCCNGMPGERKHQQRQRAINNAIYDDVGN